MAELNVVRKKKSPLPWILLALVILGILAYLLLRQAEPDTTVAPTTTDTGYTYDSVNSPAP